MEAQQFAELLKSPLQVAQLPADALRELVARYPFSASLQMLLLKQYQLNDHPAYDEQLAKAAVYAPDRRALYRLVQLKEPVQKELNLSGFEPHLPEPIMELEKELESENEVVPAMETEPETIAVPAAEEPAIWEVEPIAYTEPEGLVAEEGPLFTEEEVVAIETETPAFDEAPDVAKEKAEEPGVEETETNETVEPEIKPTLPSEQVNEVSFMPPIIPIEHFEGMKEVLEDTVVEETETAEIQTIEEVIEVELSEAILPNDLDIPKVEEEVIVNYSQNDVNPSELGKGVELKNTKPEITKDSFTGWLQRVKRHELPSASPAPMDAHDLQEKAALDALFGAGTYEATLVQESISLPEEEVSPKVVPTREELMEPDEVANRRMDEQAKKSLSMDDDLVTETLARIYEIQKKTGKAIDAYEVLKLRYPEKTDQYNAKIQALRAI